MSTERGEDRAVVEVDEADFITLEEARETLTPLIRPLPVFADVGQ